MLQLYVRWAAWQSGASETEKKGDRKFLNENTVTGGETGSAFPGGLRQRKY
jgi:hypothetical protein